MSNTHNQVLKGVARVAGTLLAAACLMSCAGTTPPSAPPPSASSTSAESAKEATVIVTVNGQDLELQLADNSSARALRDLAGVGLQLTMEDYGGFEKVGTLPQRLPTNDERITTQPGEVILYQGDKLAIYYGTNTWSLTRIGWIRDVDPAALRRALGDGNVDVTLRSR